MEKHILLSVKKMAKSGFNDQEIQDLTKKSKLALGFTFKLYPDLFDYHYEDKKHKNVVGQIVTTLHPDSFLKKIGLKEKDIVLSIDQYAIAMTTDKDKDNFAYRLDLVTQKGIDDLKEIQIKDGQKVKVFFLRPKSHMINSQMSPQTESNKIMDNYDFLTKTSEFNWLYEIENNHQINTRVKMIPIKNLSDKIKEKLFNQDHAIDKVIKVLKINAAGIKEENKPLGSFLFTGPTGVGKTELAKLLAQEMNIPLFRIDMSEFSQEHSANRLLGSPAGYVGYSDDSYLLKSVGNDKKECILLLDEMEKSHEKIHTLFLQAMDNARVTLANNKEIDFSNTLIIMTSNCGVVQKNSVGITSKEEALSVNMDQLKEKFLPEFIGRLSGVVEFNALNEDGALLIIDKLISEFNQKMKDRVRLSLENEAKQHMLENGFNKTYGARTLKNFFSNQITVQVAERILENNGNNLGDLKISVDNNQLVLRNPPTISKTTEVVSDNSAVVSLTENTTGQESLEKKGFFETIFGGKKD